MWWGRIKRLISVLWPYKSWSTTLAAEQRRENPNCTSGWTKCQWHRKLWPRACMIYVSIQVWRSQCALPIWKLCSFGLDRIPFHYNSTISIWTPSPNVWLCWSRRFWTLSSLRSRALRWMFLGRYQFCGAKGKNNLSNYRLWSKIFWLLACSSVGKSKLGRKRYLPN